METNIVLASRSYNTLCNNFKEKTTDECPLTEGAFFSLRDKIFLADGDAILRCRTANVMFI